LLDSAPAALLPNVHGMTMSGAFAASTRVSLVLRAVDAMKLSYDVRDGCHVTSVPEAIDHERFLHPFTHRVYSPSGEIREETTGPGTAAWTPLAAMSRYLPVAVLMTEDGGVFRRKGFNEAQIQFAVRTDLRERRFARGASTMTMQLAKNLFLTRDKVLARKLEEVILTKYLSERFTENDILELYLNVIEFGPDIYGAAAAARAFYGKSPAALTLAESLYLAAILPSPVKFYAMKQSGNVPPYWMAAIQHLMDLAHTSHLISDEELEEGKGESIAFR
jgi:membrane peptidoglycan carboxypeptidase